MLINPNSRFTKLTTQLYHAKNQGRNREEISRQPAKNNLASVPDELTAW
jgi:hypothetical protein